MGSEFRLTAPLQRIVLALLRHGEEPQYGLSLGKEVGLRSGTVYPLLARLEGMGWVTSAWEKADPSAIGRRLRRYYCLTHLGLEQASRMREELVVAVGLEAPTKRRAKNREVVT
jgi:DNA-binding PadR family transcriptional regulator